jgi:hypothetical protein
MRKAVERLCPEFGWIKSGELRELVEPLLRANRWTEIKETVCNLQMLFSISDLMKLLARGRGR